MSIASEHREADPPIALLVKDIVADLATLLQKQLELARLEVREDLSAMRAGVAAMLFGGLVLGAALSLGFLAASQALELHYGWPPWAGLAVASGALAVLGLAFVGFSAGRLRGRSVYPQRAAETMQENLEWLKKSRS